MRQRTFVSRAVGVVAFMSLAIGLAWPHPGSGIAVDRRGNVYFVDTGQGILKVGPEGKLTPHPGLAYHWMTIDVGDRFAKARLPSFPFGEVTPVGASPTLILSSDVPVVVGHDGNLYYPLLIAAKRVQIMRMTPEGRSSVVGTLAASGEGGRPLQWLNGMAVGPDDTVYFTEDTAIKKMAKGGAVSMVAIIKPATCAPIPGSDEGTKPYLRGLAVDAKGVVYVAASACGALLKVMPDGAVTTLLRTESPWSPTGVALHGADVYALEYLHTVGDDRSQWLPRVRKLSSNGKVSTIAAIEHR